MPGSVRVVPRQDVRFCRSADGVTIAYAVHGSGPPLVIDACWLSHLQYDGESPVWRHHLTELGKIATVHRFDERGHGLSDARHPERVGRLLFYGSYAGVDAVRTSTQDRLLDETFDRLIRVGWEQPTPEFRRVFTSRRLGEPAPRHRVTAPSRYAVPVAP